MADHLTEEEQIEALKRWWDENWKSIVLPIAVALGGYFSWNLWQQNQAAQAQSGSVKYSELLKAVETAPGTQISESQRETAKVLAQELSEAHEGSLYADQAHLILAKFAVDSGDLVTARTHLSTVADKGENDAIRALASLRLARVDVAQGDYASATARADSNAVESYDAAFEEVRGDALAAQGKTDEAKTAYEAAMEKLSFEQFSRRSIVQMKLDGIAIIAEASSKPVEPPAAQPAAEVPASEVEPEAPETPAAEAPQENS